MTAPSRPLSRQTRLLLALWRKAREAPLAIPCPDKSAGISLRIALYNAIRPYRDGDRVDDQDLLWAAQNLQAAVRESEAAWVVVLEPKRMKEEVEAFAASLGITDRDLLTESEREEIDRTEAALRQFAEQVDLSAANPFYKKED